MKVVSGATTEFNARNSLKIHQLHLTKHLPRDHKNVEEQDINLIPEDPKPGRFYILPKIHKPGNPGRHIFSENGRPPEFVSFHLNPLEQTLPSYIKNTAHFLNKLKEIGELPSNAILVTLDVSSLYTNIPTNEGIEACRKALNHRSAKPIPTETICDLIRMILTMNNFVFIDEHFLQQHGMAMGTRMAPAFANLFMGEFEKNAISGYADKPYLWYRYIDDIFNLWFGHMEKTVS